MSVSDETILAAWRRGWDTYKIATDIFGSRQAEAHVERRLRAILEKQREDDEWNRNDPKTPPHS